MRSIFAIGLLASSWLFSNSAVAGPACTGNYLLEKTFSTGAKWQLCWEHRQREGIVYHDLFYTPPGGTESKILNQANMAQIHVPYDDNGARYHDVSDYGLGSNYLNDLQSGDCPSGEFRGENNKNMLCMQTRNRNHAHAHISDNGNTNHHKIGQYFEIFSVSHVGAYNYIPTWRLYDDGTIEVIMGATGSLQRFRTGSQNQSNGWLLNNSDRYGVSHLHNYYWRLDFDLGSNANDDVVEEVEFVSQTGNLSRIKSITPFTTEVARSVAPDKYRSWRIRDGVNTNASGHTIAYQIEPLLTGHRDQGPSYEPWTHNDFYVTVNKNCEKYASHNPEVSGCTDNLSTFVNGQNLSGADIVVWYGLSFHHIPRNEDEPKMHAHWNSFKIIPRNVTVKNPLADISNNINTPPVLSSLGDQSNVVGESISLTLSASDVDGDDLTYTANGLPDGLNIASNGEISGIPSTAGVYNVTFYVNDGEATDQQEVIWTIHSIGLGGCNTYSSTDIPIAITSSGTITVTSNLNITQSGIINDVNVLNLKGRHTYMSDLDFKLTSPTGTTVQIINNSCGSKNDFELSLDGASTDSWPCPPIDGGTYKPSSSLAVFNGEQRKGDWVLTINDRYNQDGGSLDQWALEICSNSITPPNEPPVVTSPGTQSSTVADVISLAIIASDPDGDTLTFSSDSLPPGLQINSTSGIISGTLLSGSAGPHAVSISVNDGNNHIAIASFGWQVDALNQAPVLTNPGNQSDSEGNTVTLTITASDPEGDALTFSSSNLPSGLQLNSASGVISGTLVPASVGSHSVTISVNDGNGHTESVSFIWQVIALNQAPILTNPGTQSHSEGDTVSLTIAANDPNADTLTFSSSNLPSGLQLNSASGVISGTLVSASVGSHSVTVSVSDGQASDITSFTWTISEVIIPPVNDNELQNDVAITNLSAARGNEIMYVVNPGAGKNLQITISGGSGDADIYVRYGSEPTTSQYDCRPYRNGNDESCTFSGTESGTYYVMIRAYSSFSGLSIKATYEDLPSSNNELQNGVTISNLTANRGDHLLYSVSPGAGENMQISISGGSGDADIYVLYGSEPTTSQYNCRPYRNGNNETCTINSTQAGTYYVMIRAYSSFSGLSLQATF